MLLCEAKSVNPDLTPQNVAFDQGGCAVWHSFGSFSTRQKVSFHVGETAFAVRLHFVNIDIYVYIYLKKIVATLSMTKYLTRPASLKSSSVLLLF